MWRFGKTDPRIEKGLNGWGLKAAKTALRDLKEKVVLMGPDFGLATTRASADPFGETAHVRLNMAAWPVLPTLNDVDMAWLAVAGERRGLGAVFHGYWTTPDGDHRPYEAEVIFDLADGLTFKGGLKTGRGAFVPEEGF